MTTMQLSQHAATGHVEVRRSICPGRMGSNGAVRSSA
jgi:hypothetical protein